MISTIITWLFGANCGVCIKQSLWLTATINRIDPIGEFAHYVVIVFVFLKIPYVTCKLWFNCSSEMNFLTSYRMSCATIRRKIRKVHKVHYDLKFKNRRS